MGRKTRISKGKTMKPNFFVFCEGETEIAYVKLLRTIYRVPIQIIMKKSDSNINLKYINNCKKEHFCTSSDKTFLMFDLDVDGMLERLQSIPDTVLLASNPCIELWYLLHCDDCKTALNSKSCVSNLCKHFKHYKKGALTENEKVFLISNVDSAICRAKNLKEYGNPSSSIYRIIETLNNYI